MTQEESDMELWDAVMNVMWGFYIQYQDTEKGRVAGTSYDKFRAAINHLELPPKEGK
jgi:hypothetical protein